MPRSPMNRVKFGGGPDGGVVTPLYVYKDFFLPGAAPATAANFGSAFTIFHEAGTWELVAVREAHTTAGSDAGAVTIMLKKAATGTALSAGTDMLSAGINMKAAANTSQAGALHATQANIQVVGPEVQVGFVLTGTPTSLAGVLVTTVWKKI